MIKMCAIIFLCISFLKGYAQPKIDTGKLVLNSKLRMVELLDYEDEDYFQAYLSYQPKIVFLKSEGFKDEFVFYKILIKDTVVLKVPINDSMTRVKSFYSLVDGSVIFAFDGQEIYNLAGLRHTDFEYFFYKVKSIVGNKHDININRKNFSSIFVGWEWYAALKTDDNKTKDKGSFGGWMLYSSQGGGGDSKFNPSAAKGSKMVDGRGSIADVRTYKYHKGRTRCRWCFRYVEIFERCC